MNNVDIPPPHLPSPLPARYAETRDELRRVAVHILARRRHAVAGRVGLRPALGGIATPAFGDDAEVVRTRGSFLIHETGHQTRIAPLTTLADAARFVGADLSADLNVGHDTPAAGDPSCPLAIDGPSADALAEWYRLIAHALDVTMMSLPVDAGPSVTQLWPEHFDLALDVAWGPDEGQRVSLGGSPGDDFDGEPYAYVGPWGSERPDDPAFWNAPFGGALRYRDIPRDDPVGALNTFFAHGWMLLSQRAGGQLP